MPNLCHGHWENSLIDGDDDGTIDVDQAAGGRLGGKHNKSQKDIFGACIEFEEPSRILFVRFDGDSAFVYYGEIERRTTPRPHFFVQGHVMTVGSDREVAARVDDWTAEKPT